MNDKQKNTSGIEEADRSTRRIFLFLGRFLLAWSLLPLTINGQDLTLPKNPIKGRYVFEQKGCITCHSIKGEGGNIGPDLGHKKYYGSFLELAGIMWNHAPEMLRRMRELDLPYPEFSHTEMAELISYLYYLRYLGEPGDLYRGKMLVTKKGCLACHSIAGKGGKSAPAFDELSKYISPLYMAQALWNHGPEMEKLIEKMGLKRPQFGKGEIVDLSAYIREASKGIEREQIYMSPGNPQRGKLVLQEKGCLDCHAVNGDGKELGPDFGDSEWNYNVTEIAGLMWNHGSEMAELMKRQRIQWPKFSGKEMADLIAYLYFLKFTDKPGDAHEGKKVFTEKGCVNCHGADAMGSRYAPNLSKSKGPTSAIEMAQILWNHAPVMEARIAEKVMSWPQFSGNEMRDLYAYLHSLLKSE